MTRMMGILNSEEGKLTLSNSKITVNTSTEESCFGIYHNATGSAIITDSEISVTISEGMATGIYILKNSSLTAEGLKVTASTNDGNAQGIANNGTLTLGTKDDILKEDSLIEGSDQGYLGYEGSTFLRWKNHW